MRKHGSAWIMQATAAPGGPGTQGSHGHTADDVEKLEESGRVWKWREAGLWGAVPRWEEPGLLKERMKGME